MLTVPELKPTPSSIWDLSHIIVTKHSGVLCGLMTSESCHCDFGYSQIVGTHRALSNNAGPEHCPIPPARGPHPPQLSPPPWDSNPFRGHICSESHIWGIAKSPGTFACIFEQGSRRPPNCCSESIACILAFDAVHAGCMESRRFRKSNFNGCFPKRTWL